MNTLQNPQLHKDSVMPCFNFYLEDMSGEEWVDIIGYDGIYQVSNLGRVKSIGRFVNTLNGSQKWVNEKILKGNVNSKNKLLKKERDVKFIVNNISSTHLVCTLVADAFLRDRSNNERICQIDKNQFNCELSNLKIVSVSECVLQSYNKGKAKDWGIGNMIKNERKEYELNNGIFKNGELIKIKCSCCGEIKSVNDFYFKKNNIRRECKDCTIKKRGTKNLGKLRFREKLAEKGRRICSVCKQEKDLYIDFGKSKNIFMGRSNTCKECAKKLNAKCRALNKA